MPASVRHELLRDSGYSSSEIQKHLKMANVVRKSRKNTIDMTSHMSGLSETKEKLTRNLSNLTLKRGKKKKEQKYIEKAIEMDHSYTEGQSFTNSSSGEENDPSAK